MRERENASSYLSGLRVLEIGGDLVEYCGRLLSGLGADVVKVEPFDGEPTRRHGPFVDDIDDPNGSLYFWHYNLGKRSVTIDFESAAGRRQYAQLAERADVILDGRAPDYLKNHGCGYEVSSALNPGLIQLDMSEFGVSGPWAHFTGSDIVHLALGGVMMNCGYDRDPNGQYDTPPIAPQMEQSYHIAGEMAAMAILAAIHHRTRTGEGQLLDADVHSAVSANTETDVPDWVYLRQPHHRQTCRHSTFARSTPAIARTRDGRWLLPYSTYLKGMDDGLAGTLQVLGRYGMVPDLPEPAESDARTRSAVAHAIADLVQLTSFDDHLWRDGQDVGLAWAPVRRPEENLSDPHWEARGVFRRIRHPELDRDFDYVVSRWVGSDGPWPDPTRPPLLGEDTVAEVLDSWAIAVTPSSLQPTPSRSPGPPSSPGDHRAEPFALKGVKILDLGWIVASAGAGRFLSAFGAEVIKVEHESRWDGLRWGLGAYPEGGRAARDRAEAPLPSVDWDDPNRGGAFMEINAGKLGLSLNLKTAEGKAILTTLIERADALIEGFSPGTLERMGFGWAELQRINPRLVYVQQSGFGQEGTYGRARAFGPTAQAFTGLSEMSGLPEPYAPAGIGYSYLDWFGAYNVANAVLAGLVQRDRTEAGCHIDASQGEVGLYLTGSAVLNHSANGRRWQRYGNRSPFKRAAPHGAYRVLGDDRWIAIGCFTATHWPALVDALGRPPWAAAPRFATLESRSANADELDALIEQETQVRDGYELMESLQAAGVPAGVCQTAEDRIDHDPQLAHHNWQVELDQKDIGRWPVKEFPVRFSRTPAYMGGLYDRSGPSYGQDTDYVLRELLAMPPEQIARLRQDDVL